MQKCVYNYVYYLLLIIINILVYIQFILYFYLKILNMNGNSIFVSLSTNAAIYAIYFYKCGMYV